MSISCKLRPNSIIVTKTKEASSPTAENTPNSLTFFPQTKFAGDVYHKNHKFTVCIFVDFLLLFPKLIIFNGLLYKFVSRMDIEKTTLLKLEHIHYKILSIRCNAVSDTSVE